MWLAWAMTLATTVSTWSGSMPSAWPMCIAQISERRLASKSSWLRTSVRMAWRFWLTMTKVDRKIASRLTIHGEQPERVPVELHRGADQTDVEHDPDAEPDRVQVDEVQRPGEGGDHVGGPVLAAFEGVDELVGVLDPAFEFGDQPAVLDAVGAVHRQAGGTMMCDRFLGHRHSVAASLLAGEHPFGAGGPRPFEQPNTSTSSPPSRLAGATG